MKHVSSGGHDSILRDSVEAVKHFNWETVRLELLQQTPTLMSLLTQLVGRASERCPLLCLLASMICKSRHQHMGLVQRAMSVKQASSCVVHVIIIVINTKFTLYYV